MQVSRPNILSYWHNEFGLHFNENLIVHKGILMPISY